MWLWYLDRGAAVVAYPALWFSVLTGILYNVRRFGALHRAARRLHVPSSVLASATMVLHVLAGIADTWLVEAGRVPSPDYPEGYFLTGVAVGAGALLLTVTSVLGFIDARRFKRPWDPKAVHAFAYGGFVFATVHAAAIGTDFVKIIRPGLVAATAFLLCVLLLRVFAERFTPRPTDRSTGPRAGP